MYMDVRKYYSQTPTTRSTTSLRKVSSCTIIEVYLYNLKSLNFQRQGSGPCFRYVPYRSKPNAHTITGTKNEGTSCWMFEIVRNVDSIGDSIVILQLIFPSVKSLFGHVYLVESWAYDTFHVNHKLEAVVRLRPNPEMLEQAITYAPRNGYPFNIIAKRYWAAEFQAHSNDPSALTLIVLHSTSFHKETWEPTLQHLFDIALQNGNSVKIREAWALDCPNHGESALLNERVFADSLYRHSFSCEKYAQAVHHFLSAGTENGAGVDFRKRNLVGIGHSLGANAILVLQHLEPVFPFVSVTIADPMLSAAGSQHFVQLGLHLVKGAYERRDVWASREEAMISLKERTKKWDPSVLALFIKFAIRPHPGSYYKNLPYNGFTLACTRDEEAAMYRDTEGGVKPVEDLSKACSSRPVHIILGGVNDLLSKDIHSALIDPRSGRRFASITRISESGHLIPQEVPEKLAAALYKTLFRNPKYFQPKL